MVVLLFVTILFNSFVAEILLYLLDLGVVLQFGLLLLGLGFDVLELTDLDWFCMMYGGLLFVCWCVD